MAKQKCSVCGRPYEPQWYDRGMCLECDQDAAWQQLQSIRAIDAELARRGEPVRPGWLSADPKQGGRR